MKKFVNFLSIFRAIISIVIIPTMLYNRYMLTFVLFTLAAISDWFDGYLAKKFNCCTKLGGVLDHVSDKLLVCNMFLLLPFIPVDLTFITHFYTPIARKIWFVLVPIILMLDRELYISGLREFLGTQKVEMPVPSGRFSMGKIKTTLQMASLAIIIFGVSVYQLPGSKALVDALSNLIGVGIAGLWVALIASFWSAAQYTVTFKEKIKKLKL